MEDRWERDALRDVALAVVKEQRRARRWGIFFKLVLIAYVTFLLLMWSPLFGEPSAVATRHTAVIEVSGPIMTDAPASAERIIAGLQAAFEEDNVAGVILRLESPGGSPVHAGRVNDEIRRLRAQRPEVPVYSVVGEMAASGAYYIAAATDRIYVDKASLVGSIGVVMSSFGLTQAMQELGVERRLYTAGEHKGFLDPFLPEDPEQVRHVNRMLEQIHRQFITVVKEGRGDRLAEDAAVFNGLIWTGERSIELGLADELGSLEFVSREVIGAEQMIDYTPREGLLSRFADRLGAAAGTRLAALLDSGAPVLR